MTKLPASRRLPRPLLMALEARAVLEAGAALLSLPLLSRAPQGDGHPVLLLPGLGTTDRALMPMQRFLASRGYAVETWGLGRNPGFNRKFANVVEQKIRYLHYRHGRRVSLVGWSMGGVFAFYASHVAPECVRTSISLGSPLHVDADDPPPPAMRAMYRVVADPLGPLTHEARSRSKAMRNAPPVPSTCIFSESDGLVPPEQAVLQGDPSMHENVRVPGSHVGLPLNPLVMWIVADRLALPEGGWRPFRPDALAAPFFRAAGSSSDAA